jgi:23S rRNA (adenine-N6)-dimethyltransferase
VAGRRPAGAPPPRPRSQHFLRAERAAELIRDACIAADEVVVDLGAGTGRLTVELARVARRVVAVELDARLAERLSRIEGNVVVVKGDATNVPLPREPFRVVASLPFDRTTDLLHHLLDDPQTPLSRADLVVEWDVARKRALPWPSTVNGVQWGVFYEMSVVRRLLRTDFEPRPRVDAGVLVVRRRTTPLVAPEDAVAFRRFVARGFRQGLRTVSDRRTLRSTAHPRATARELDAHQWAVLYDASR